jgi:hypothetical protein
MIFILDSILLTVTCACTPALAPGHGLAPVCKPPRREGKTRSVFLGGDKKVKQKGAQERTKLC